MGLLRNYKDCESGRLHAVAKVPRYGKYSGIWAMLHGPRSTWGNGTSSALHVLKREPNHLHLVQSNQPTRLHCLNLALLSFTSSAVAHHIYQPKWLCGSYPSLLCTCGINSIDQIQNTRHPYFISAVLQLHQSLGRRWRWCERWGRVHRCFSSWARPLCWCKIPGREFSRKTEMTVLFMPCADWIGGDSLDHAINL